MDVGGCHVPLTPRTNGSLTSVSFKEEYRSFTTEREIDQLFLIIPKIQPPHVLELPGNRKRADDHNDGQGELKNHE
jgi:hypothetical protein